MPPVAKPFNRDEVIESLTEPHEGCAAPDQTIFSVEDFEDLDRWSQPTLEAYRLQTKTKRKPKVSTGEKPVRKTLMKDGVCSITIPLIVDEDVRTAFAVLNIKTSADADAHLSKFVTSMKGDGPGAGAYIEPDERLEGTVKFNVNQVVKSMVLNVAEAAKHVERVKTAGEYITSMIGMRKLEPERYSDSGIKEILSAAMSKVMTEDQVEAVLSDAFKKAKISYDD